MARSLYDILGVSDSASEKEISEAFEALAKDLSADDASYREIKNAYDILSDMNRRARYDIQGKVSVGQRRRRGSGTGNRMAKARYILNSVFLAAAAVTTVLFLLQWSGFSTTPFYISCSIAILLKVAEYILRLIP